MSRCELKALQMFAAYRVRSSRHHRSMIQQELLVNPFERRLCFPLTLEAYPATQTVPLSRAGPDRHIPYGSDANEIFVNQENSCKIFKISVGPVLGLQKEQRVSFKTVTIG